MSDQPKMDPRAFAQAKLEGRRRRIALLRRRVATGTLVAFTLCLGGYLYQDATGARSEASTPQSGQDRQPSDSKLGAGEPISIPSIPLVTSQS